MYRHLLSLGVSQTNAIATSLETCYKDYQLGVQVGLIPQINMPITSLVRATTSQVVFESLHQSALSLNTTKLQMKDFLDLKGPHAKTVQQLIDCLQCNLPVLIVTNDA